MIEDFSKPEQGKRIIRGIAVARRDNFKAVVAAQNTVINAALAGGNRPPLVRRPSL